jgi:trans-aconitate 2-methyltransferase
LAVWDPQQYDVYADERSRPFHELLARVPAKRPKRVVDLGCGNGALTATLAERWPEATVLGIDSSAEMLAAAEVRALPGRLSFRRDTIEDWRPAWPVDVLVSNAALHWVPDHPALLGRWVADMAPGGWLAFQVPGNFDSPTHLLLAELRRSSRWAQRLADLPDRGPGVRPPADYLALLSAAGCRVDAWETTYLHVLTGPDPVLDWVRGTALRPVLARLADDPAAVRAFEQEYGARLRTAYPGTPHGTVLPFRRVFVVAHRPG